MRTAFEFDRYAPLALQVHGVEDLLRIRTLVQGARELDEAVGQGRLPVVDVATMQKLRM